MNIESDINFDPYLAYQIEELGYHKVNSDFINKFDIEGLKRALYNSPTFHKEDKSLLLSSLQDKDLVEILLKYGKNPLGKSSLYAAVLTEDLHAVETLLKSGAKVDAEVESLAKRVGNKALFILFNTINPSSGLKKYSFSISKKTYMFSTVFEIDSPELGASQLVKNKISLNTKYSLESDKGIEAVGTARILSMGSLFAWAKDIDIYDQKGAYVGMIDGEALTTAEAKFSFYDDQGNQVGIAYLDENKVGFTLVHPEKPARVIARFSREYVPGTIDSWNVKVYHGEDIDMRLIKIFSAFAIDSQAEFKEDH